MTQTLNVEYDEIMARAAEMDESLPPAPSGTPAAPCAISFVCDAGMALADSADALRRFLSAWEVQRERLAQSLRNAAKAYEEVDEEGANAVTNNVSVSARGTGSGGMMALNCDPDEDFYPPPPPPPPPVELPYYEVRQAATDIEAPDQGKAFEGFANDWDRFQQLLQRSARRFEKPFTQWEGASATAVEANFAAHRKWIFGVAAQCRELAKQARTVTATQRWALTQHPTSYDVYYLDEWYRIMTTEPYWMKHPDTPRHMRDCLYQYGQLQAKSEEVLAEYIRRASLALPPIYPELPPNAHRIDPPKNDDDGDGDGGDGGGDGGDGLPDDELPDDELPSTPPPPSTPSMPPTGIPPMSGDELKDALAGLQGTPGGEPSLKPASVGGGGGGGGVPGLPSMPMQPAVGAESVASGGPGGPGAGAGPGAGRGLPGGMGGPMGGMAPMAPGAGGQGKQEGKRGPSEDESLYEEDRPWTEAVIGNRRRKDAPDK